jgi:hypothetical protein
MGFEPVFTISDQSVSIAKIYFGVSIPLLIVTIIVFCNRIYLRIWPKWRIELADVFIVVGFVSVISPVMMLPIACIGLTGILV